MLLEFMHKDNMGQTAALRRLAALTHRAYDGLFHLWNIWQTQRLIAVVSSKNRGAGAAPHINHVDHVDGEIVSIIANAIRKRNSEGGGCTTTMLLSILQASHGFTMHARTLRNVLHSMGFRYGRANDIGKINDPFYLARIRSFFLSYSEALVEEKAGRCVIVYTDETHVHATHNLKFTWYNPEDPQKNDVVHPSGKGPRLIIIHAITKDGLLLPPPLPRNMRGKQSQPSAGIMWVPEKQPDGSTDNMNGETYLKYLKDNILPTFALKYPGQKMKLMLDNAPYHHPHDSEWISVSAMSKAEIAAKLIEFGFTTITVKRQMQDTSSVSSITFKSNTFNKRGGLNAPTLAELKEILSEYLTQHPEVNRTAVRKLFDAEGHELLYTPPYLPRVQPIERVWAYIKHRLAVKYKVGRTMTQLKNQTQKAFGGDPPEHAGVTADLCVKEIVSVAEYCNHLISEDKMLQGNLDNLQLLSDDVLIDEEYDIAAELDPFAFPGQEDESDSSDDE